MSTQIEHNPHIAENNAREEGRQSRFPTTGKLYATDALHISRLAVKVDGETDHVFIAILNGSAVGQVIAKIQDWKACAIRMLYVMPFHRHKGIASRLMQTVEHWATGAGATQLELCCMKGNTPGRNFWIRKQRFIDDNSRHADGPRAAEYACMVKEI